MNNPELPKMVPKEIQLFSSDAFRSLRDYTKDHHPACGCGACCAYTYWDFRDDATALAREGRPMGEVLQRLYDPRQNPPQGNKT